MFRRIVLTIVLASALVSGRSLVDPIRELPPATTGQSYGVVLKAASEACSISGVTWELAAGALPEGLTISSKKLSGSTLVTGEWEFALRASTACTDRIVPFRLVVRQAGQADLTSVQSRSRKR